MRNNKSEKKRRGTACILFGLLLMAAALFLAIYNQAKSEDAGRASKDVLERLEEQITSEEQTELYQNMPVMIIEGNRYIGVLEIPSLDLSLPVMADWDYEKMEVSPCRFGGSYYTGDLVIAGHNYLRHFGALTKIRAGEDVFFTNVEGRVYHYAAESLETLQPAQVEEMLCGDWDLTLFTCTVSGRGRYALRCVEVKSGK